MLIDGGNIIDAVQALGAPAAAAVAILWTKVQRLEEDLKEAKRHAEKHAEQMQNHALAFGKLAGAVDRLEETLGGIIRVEFKPERINQ